MLNCCLFTIWRKLTSQAGWLTPLSLALTHLKHEDGHELEASLDYRITKEEREKKLKEKKEGRKRKRRWR